MAIITGLRSFTRLNVTDLKNCDIIEGLESTLILLKNSYKHRIEIIREYDKIPLIDCYPGKLNQVFMNFLSNAIQAIKGTGTITIKTEHVGDVIKISIRDTGEGIKEENKSKIFMPFYTTKEAGQGTGLGLSISHSIIEEHHGSISFSSEEGKGSEFIITLPIKHCSSCSS
jgi:signal transduction histidine kinase